MAVIDFPPYAPAPGGGHDPATARGRLCFREPVSVLQALTLAEVQPVIAEAERLARAGRWVVGLVRYDAAPAFDDAMTVLPELVEAGWPLAWFAAFDRAEELPTSAALADDDAPAPVLEWRAHADEAHHARAVEAIRDAIANGDVYQVNHTLRLRADWDGRGALPLYERMQRAQPSGYSAYLRIGTRHVLSASPELFHEVRGRTVRCRPMKGTAPRGRFPEEDDAAAGALLRSAKDRAENVMIVDLIRNDLGRVAQTGSVRVTSQFDVERYPTVLQLTSTIEARLRDDVRLPELFAALFPCGSVTGAPKIAAMQQIAVREGAPRGAYCGAIGLIRPGGDCTFNVAIRTAVLDERTGRAEYGTGGGITMDSEPAGEHRELLAKAAVLTAAPRPDMLVETMRLDAGVIPRLGRHLARLQGSARYFGFRTPKAARDSLRRAAERHAEGLHRVRLLADADGTVSVDVEPLARSALGVDDVAAGRSAASGTKAPGAANTPPREVVLATSPVHSADVLLFHKTTARATYDRQRAAHAGAWDVILWNERGELTEFTIGNLVVELEGRLWTPPRECGLLAGTMRAELLERGEIAERVLRRDHLEAASALWLVNSLRGWVRVALQD